MKEALGVSLPSCTFSQVEMTPLPYDPKVRIIEKEKGKLGAYAMKRVAAGAHLSTPWLFELAKLSDDRADYCLDCSFLS